MTRATALWQGPLLQAFLDFDSYQTLDSIKAIGGCFGLCSGPILRPSASFADSDTFVIWRHMHELMALTARALYGSLQGDDKGNCSYCSRPVCLWAGLKLAS